MFYCKFKWLIKNIKSRGDHLIIENFKAHVHNKDKEAVIVFQKAGNSFKRTKVRGEHDNL